MGKYHDEGGGSREPCKVTDSRAQGLAGPPSKGKTWSGSVTRRPERPARDRVAW